MRILVDTGPLVALLNANDQHHAWTVSALEELAPPLYTCEAVLSEAYHILGRVPNGRKSLLRILDSGRLEVLPAVGGELARMSALLAKYADIPMSFADACLVHLYEDGRNQILTLDSDFLVFRSGRKRIRLLSPFRS